MTHDIVIRNGSIVDGTGAEAVAGDLAIDDGRITAIGKVTSGGHTDIDADGHVVSPGFVDLHTHLDAQIGWDPDLTPVSWHGVTTALLGNCGVTFAPCRPDDRALLAGMMETVEDIPRQAILSGLPWTWETYGGYLDALDKLQPGINVGGLVGHSALRYYVMGERAVDEQPTDAEIAQMAEVLGKAIDDGAIGFSTNRYAGHVLPDGRPIPGTFAQTGELAALAKAVTERGALMQIAADEDTVFAAMKDLPGGRILFSAGVSAKKGSGEAGFERLEKLAATRDISACSLVRGTGYMFGLQAPLPFTGESWNKLQPMSLAARLAAIRDPETAAKLVAETGDKSPIPLENVFYLGDADIPDYATTDNVIALAAAANETFTELFLRLSRETNGRALFVMRALCPDIGEIGDFLKSPHVFPGLGDAGAHVAQIMDAGWGTFMLSHWIRREGLFTLGEGIKRMTSGPARVMGLSDRGVLAVGKRADVNVFDFDRVTELQPYMAHDIPGGAPHYSQRARGYKATIVNGQVNILDDELTGARAGAVLRHVR